MRTLAALFAALLPVAALAANETLPAPKDLLAQMIKSHQALGPVQINMDVTVKRPSKPLMNYSATIAWNDPSHMAVNLQRGPLTGEVTTNGSEQWTYLSAHNVYMRGAPNGMAFLSPNIVVEMLGKEQGDPAFQKDLARAKVSLASADGETAYRLYMPSSTGADKAAGKFAAFLVGKDDGLVRKIAVHNGKGSDVSITIGYTRMTGPFPASTFQFRPPAGAREIANDLH